MVLSLHGLDVVHGELERVRGGLKLAWIGCCAWGASVARAYSISHQFANSLLLI